MKPLLFFSTYLYFLCYVFLIICYNFPILFINLPELKRISNRIHIFAVS